VALEHSVLSSASAIGLKTAHIKADSKASARWLLTGPRVHHTDRGVMLVGNFAGNWQA
jgi:hypothetical protein